MHKISFSILIYLNYDRFLESEITLMSIHAYQTSYNAKSISQASVSFPASAFNKGIRLVLQVMPGVVQMLHHFYHEFPLLTEVVTLFNYKYVVILWL